MRRDETEVGEAKALTIIDGQTADIGRLDGLDGAAPLHREVFDHLSEPGRVAVLSSWRTLDEAEAFARRIRGRLSPQAQVYAIRVIRDYGKSDRREAPQFYPPEEPSAP